MLYFILGSKKIFGWSVYFYWRDLDSGFLWYKKCNFYLLNMVVKSGELNYEDSISVIVVVSEVRCFCEFVKEIVLSIIVDNLKVMKWFLWDVILLNVGVEFDFGGEFMVIFMICYCVNDYDLDFLEYLFGVIGRNDNLNMLWEFRRKCFLILGSILEERISEIFLGRIRLNF